MPSDKVPLYDELGREYDTMVSWPGRLEREWPFIRAQLKLVAARRVLDVGTGTGMHAIWFAQHGLKAVGTDPSQEMLNKAQENAAGTNGVRFEQASLGEHAARVDGQFDAISSLGNTLPHVLTESVLLTALRDLRAVLRAGGVLIIQQLNYDRILAIRQRFLGLSSGQQGAEELLFFRFYDFPEHLVPDSTLTFNVAIFRRAPSGWTYRVESTKLHPIQSEQLAQSLRTAGFDPVTFYGGYAGEQFDPLTSNDLIAVAKGA